MEIPRHFGVDVGSSLAGAFPHFNTALWEANFRGILNLAGNDFKFWMKTISRQQNPVISLFHSV